MIEYFKETVEKDTSTIVGWVYDGDDDSASALLVQRRIRQVALDRPQKNTRKTSAMPITVMAKPIHLNPFVPVVRLSGVTFLKEAGNTR